MDAQSPKVAVFDTKPYDREYLAAAEGSDAVQWTFHEFRLMAENAQIVAGANSVCVFVNDVVDAEALGILADCGVKHIGLRCAGFNNVDLHAAEARGIAVTRVPNYSPYAVAEHTVGLLLCLNRKIHRAYNRVREFNFSLNGLVGFDLHGKTAGIVGTGKIGRILAGIFRGFGMRVIAMDPYPDPTWAADAGVEYASLEDLLCASDVVSLHVPLTPETHHIVNEKTLALMKPGVVLLNVSRGALIHTKALIDALKSGHVGGVALDVYEEEEGVFFEDLSGLVLEDDELARLLTFPNVLITAHQAFMTREAMEEISRVTVGNILRAARDEDFLEQTKL